jgi:hypothetical protein
VSGQSWCPECGKPFMYYPVKDEVVQVGEVWMHVHCRMLHAVEIAWGIIANASGGNWDHPDNSRGWKQAAERWRDWDLITGAYENRPMEEP